MKRKVINKNSRKKAFIGAAIGAVGNLAGGIIGAYKQKRAQEKAYRQAQKEQTQNEGFQQAQAMSAQYANQDYVDEYRNKITLKNGGKVNMKKKGNDRIVMAKKLACGGRKKAGLGSEIANDFKNIGQEFKGDNLGNTIVGAINGIASGINNSYASKPNYTSNLQSTATTTNYINNAQEIARNAEQLKRQRTTAAKYGTRKSCACGGRKKALFGIGTAIGGISSALGAAFQSTTPQKQVKKSAGFAYEAPKTGIEQNSYQTDANGNPLNAVNINNAAQPTTNGTNAYNDRMNMARMGTRRKCKK